MYVYVRICTYIRPPPGVRIKKQCSYTSVYLRNIRTYIDDLYKSPNKYTFTNVYARILFVYRSYTHVYRPYIANIRAIRTHIRTYTYAIRTLYEQCACVRIRTYTSVYCLKIRTYIVRIRRIYTRARINIRSQTYMHVYCSYIVRISTYIVCILQIYELYERIYVRIRTLYVPYTNGASVFVYVRIAYVYGLEIRTYFTCIYKDSKNCQCNIRTYMILKYVRISPVYTSTQKFLKATYVRIRHKFEKAVYILPNGGYCR